MSISQWINEKRVALYRRSYGIGQYADRVPLFIPDAQAWPALVKLFGGALPYARAMVYEAVVNLGATRLILVNGSTWGPIFAQAIHELGLAAKFDVRVILMDGDLYYSGEQHLGQPTPYVARENSKVARAPIAVAKIESNALLNRIVDGLLICDDGNSDRDVAIQQPDGSWLRPSNADFWMLRQELHRLRPDWRQIVTVRQPARAWFWQSIRDPWPTQIWQQFYSEGEDFDDWVIAAKAYGTRAGMVVGPHMMKTPGTLKRQIEYVLFSLQGDCAANCAFSSEWPVDCIWSYTGLVHGLQSGMSGATAFKAARTGWWGEVREGMKG